MNAIRQWPFLIIASLLLSHTKATSSSNAASSGSRLLLLDVDNTLYEERCAGIESQIIRGTHSYCQDVLGMDSQMADELYKQYGSTIEGLQHTVWKDLSESELQEKLEGFYHAVYDDVDPTSLLLPDMGASSGSTGYSHDSKEQRKMTRQLLKSSPLPIALASNSPSWHICKVLRALGLANVSKECKMFTPDRLCSYPTKNQPEKFFAAAVDDENDSSGLDQYTSASFLDDSLYNLKRVKGAFPLLIDVVHHINRKHESGDCEMSNTEFGEENLVQALIKDFGLINPTYHLSQTRYLESKNKVDRQSLHAGIWNKVVQELKDIMLDNNSGIESGTATDDEPLSIVDLGAGLLSMLDLLVHGDAERGLMALSPMSETLENQSKSKIVRYTAYESNQELYESCNQRLLSWDFFVTKNTASNEDGRVDTIDYQKDHNGVKIQVRLILRNFADDDSDYLHSTVEASSPNLIIGCCFADLIDPEQLVPDLLRAFGLLNLSASRSTPKGTLIYFPITFTGTTQFFPPSPFEFQSDGTAIPSDTVGFRSYSRALDTVLGHNLDPYLLQDVMEDYGANLIDFGASDWKIDPERDTYLHETMLYFFGSTGGPQLLKEGWDAPGWIERAQTNRPAIRVSNQDLLFRIAPYTKLGPDNASSIQSENMEKMSEILFTAPHEVTSVERDIPSTLGPKQVLGQFSIRVCTT